MAMLVITRGYYSVIFNHIQSVSSKFDTLHVLHVGMA